jgi:hypothetical protein
MTEAAEVSVRRQPIPVPANGLPTFGVQADAQHTVRFHILIL